MAHLAQKFAAMDNVDTWERIGLSRTAHALYEHHWDDHSFTFYPGDDELVVLHCSGREAVHSVKTTKTVRKIIARYVEGEYSLF